MHAAAGSSTPPPPSHLLRPTASSLQKRRSPIHTPTLSPGGSPAFKSAARGARSMTAQAAAASPATTVGLETLGGIPGVGPIAAAVGSAARRQHRVSGGGSSGGPVLGTASALAGHGGSITSSSHSDNKEAACAAAAGTRMSGGASATAAGPLQGAKGHVKGSSSQQLVLSAEEQAMAGAPQGVVYQARGFCVL